MTSGAIHVSQVPESGWPRPLPPPLGCNLSTNRKRKPKWRRCVAASIAVGASAILTGARTRPSDWGSNARFGPWKTEETIVGLPRLLVLSVFSRFGGRHLYHRPSPLSSRILAGTPNRGSTVVKCLPVRNRLPNPLPQETVLH